MAAKFFGQFLLENGVVNGDQLVKAVEIQATTNVMLGTRAIDAGLMTSEDVEKVNLLQRSLDKRFGEIAVDNGMLTEDQLRQLLSTQKDERLFLGEALIKTEALTSLQLGQQLEAFKKEVQGVPGTVAEIYHELPNASALEICTDVAAKMFLRMLHTFVKPSSCHDDTTKLSACEYTIYQSFRGEFQGQICLNVSANLLKTIAGKLLESEVTAIDSDALDGAGEFINVISGNICGQMSAAGRKVELDPPTVHDWKMGAFKFVDGALTVTTLLHPDEVIELCVVDQSAQ